MENIMTSMDVKAISWVGDMYQKFEAMCVEVEENVYQDSVKYFESQVKTVGTCVKRFYSDVVQDLLPVSSDDLLKPENSGLMVVHCADGAICNKSDVDVKREKKKSENVVLSSNFHLSSQLDGILDNGLSLGSYNSNSVGQMLPKEFTAVECLGLHAQESENEELCLSNKSEKKLGPSEETKLDLLSNDEESTSGLGDETAVNSVNLIISKSAVLDNFGNDEDTTTISDALCNEPVWAEFEIDDIDKEAFPSSEQLSKQLLEESCVLVDKYELFSASPPEGKHRSYKKKIRDVFHLRKWSSSRNLKEDNDSSNDAIREMTLSASTTEATKTNSLESSSVESGWEIL